MRQLARKLPDISLLEVMEFVFLLAEIERLTSAGHTVEGLSEEEMGKLKVDLGQNFSKMRVNAGLSQKDFCEKTGISQPQISALESGKAAMNAYAPLLFSLSVLGTQSLLEKAESDYSVRWDSTPASFKKA